MSSILREGLTYWWIICKEMHLLECYLDAMESYKSCTAFENKAKKGLAWIIVCGYSGDAWMKSVMKEIMEMSELQKWHDIKRWQSHSPD